jgi:hypothetical protein
VSEPTEADRLVGRLLLDLTRRFADAVANGEPEIADRWAGIAFRIRGRGTFVDLDRPLDQGNDAR